VSAHAFGSEFTVGIEDELLLVDPDTYALHHGAEQLMPLVDLPEGMAAHEAFAAEIELRTPVCATADEAERSVRGLIRRTPECAVHVHVGLPDPDAAIVAFNALRGHLPVLAGLAASSPFWFGSDSGLASARSAITRAYPGRGAPPAFRDFADYERAVASAAAVGGPDNYTMLWWDVRPHPLLGTVEVREMDVQARLEDTASLAALIQGLARAAVERPEPPLPPEPIGWSAFRAARDGVDAEVLLDGSLRPFPEVARKALELARPHARELGSGDALEGVERILREGGGARRQRAAAAAGGVEAVVDAIVQETAASGAGQGSSAPPAGR
jgi:carboxylate-amine ligase